MLDSGTFSKNEILPSSWNLPCGVRLPLPAHAVGHSVTSAPDLCICGTADTFSLIIQRLGVPRAIPLNSPPKLWSLKTSEGLTSYAQLLPAALGICLLAADVCFLRWGLGAGPHALGLEGPQLGLQ